LDAEKYGGAGMKRFNSTNYPLWINIVYAPARGYGAVCTPLLREYRVDVFGSEFSAKEYVAGYGCREKVWGNPAIPVHEIDRLRALNAQLEEELNLMKNGPVEIRDEKDLKLALHSQSHQITKLGALNAQLVEALKEIAGEPLAGETLPHCKDSDQFWGSTSWGTLRRARAAIAAAEKGEE
jgi:hypothetical protein